MKLLVYIFAAALMSLCGLTSSHAQTGATITPEVSNPAAVTVKVGFTLSSDWKISSTSVIKSSTASGMPLWTLNAVAESAPVANAPTPQKVNLTYELGAVDPGITGKILWKYNGKSCAESTFTVPAEGIRATASISVDPMPSAVKANVHLDFLEYAAITGQKPPIRDGKRFILEASAERAAVIQIFPPPPLPSSDLEFALGEVAAGEYAAVFKLNGAVLAEKPFTVSSKLPPIEATVTGTFVSGSTGTTASVRIVLPDPYFAMSEPGTPVRTGNVISVNAALLPIATLVALPAPKIIETEYPLGLLDPGEYTFVYQINEVTRLSQSFRVGEINPPSARLVSVEARFLPAPGRPGEPITGVWQGVAHLMLMPDVVASAGPLVKAEHGSSATVLLHLPGRPISPEDRPAPVDVTWELGLPPVGEYIFSVTLPMDPPQVKQTSFRVAGPSPPVDPLPIVACLAAGLNEAGSFVDLCLAWPVPGLAVTEWGVPVRDGNAFKSTLIIGKAGEGDDGELNNPIPGGMGDLVPADGNITADMLSPLREIGGWPMRLVRHRYALGLLPPGTYHFSVGIGSRSLARLEFSVSDAVRPLPVVTVVAEPIRIASSAPASFTLTFKASTGWPDDPTLGKVTVKGPHDFNLTATRRSGGIVSLDPLGMLAIGQYDIEAPDGGWDTSDNGRYGIFIDPDVVRDRTGNTPSNPVGLLSVQILPTPPVFPPALKADVAVAMADGKWTANVSFDNSGRWWLVDWGEVKLRGNVLSAGATLREIPPELDIAIQDSFSHRFPLGELKPGEYSFFFHSNAGHIGQATISVPGLEPPSLLDAWKFNVFGPDHWLSLASEDDADGDYDGRSVLEEFALGGNPLRSDVPDYTVDSLTDSSGVRHLALFYRRALGSETTVDCVVEVSTDLKEWRPAGSAVEITPGEAGADGTQSICACQTAPLATSQFPYMRLRIQRK